MAKTCGRAASIMPRMARPTRQPSNCRERGAPTCRAVWRPSSANRRSGRATEHHVQTSHDATSVPPAVARNPVFHFGTNDNRRPDFAGSYSHVIAGPAIAATHTIARAAPARAGRSSGSNGTDDHPWQHSSRTAGGHAIGRKSDPRQCAPVALGGTRRATRLCRGMEPYEKGRHGPWNDLA